MKRKTERQKPTPENDVKEASDGDDLGEEQAVDVTQTVSRFPKSSVDAPPSKVAKMSKGELYKPPTNDEINQLKETENLFHSTLFRMQITELLAEVKLKSKRQEQMSEAVDLLKHILLDMEQGGKFEIQNQKWLKKSEIRMPVVQAPSKIKGSFQFFTPRHVTVTGSFLSDTCVRPHTHVDLLVQMPKESFDPKDFLNQRYIRKRALYLSKVAMMLAKNPQIDNIKFTYLHGNHFKPLLIVAVKVDGHKSVNVHLHAVPEKDAFKMNRFHVSKNNIRPQWFYSQQEQEKQTGQDSATPFYNSSILEDVVAHSSQDCLQRLQDSSPGIKEGIVLLKIWLRQRGLDVGHGGFSGFILSIYVSYLLSQKKLNPHMSSYQVMRNTFLRLSQSDWTVEGISLCKETTDVNMPTLSEFHQQCEVVFVDHTGYMNLCYAMNKSLFHRVKHEACLAMTMLEDKSVDSFDKLFMKSIPFSLKFDTVFHLCPLESLKTTLKKLKLDERSMDYGGNIVYTCLPAICEIVQKGLGRRITLLQVQQQDSPIWNIKESPPSQVDKLTFGLLFDTEFAFSVLDRGPSADSTEAEEFRRFWGNKSELRRFQDGGICEAVLWAENATMAQKREVCNSVIKYSLKRHASIESSCVHYQGGHIDDLLHLPVKLTGPAHTMQYGTGEEQNSSVIQVYDEMCRLLRDLDNLPLTIHSIQGVSPCFRYTEVFPPMPCTFSHVEDRAIIEGVKRYIPSTEKPCPLYTPTLKVICTLESSGKWPEDLEAMRRLKAAFHVQLADAIKSKYNLPVRIGINYVDVLKDHFVFRLVLAYTREISLLKTLKTPDGMTRKRDTDEALALEKDTLALPKLTSTLHGLQQQHTSFSTTVRLAKRWVCSQLLGDYIDTVAVELIVASLYLTPAPNVPPRSGTVGLQRFLEHMSTFDWKTTPLMVNLNDEYTEADMTEIPTRFSKDRATLPLMFISTPLDKYSSHWTKRTPVPVILQRLVLLAQKSLVVLQQQLMDSSEPDLKQIFRPSLDMYNILIHLNQKQLPRLQECVDVAKDMFTPTYGKAVDDERFPVTDFDPVRLLVNELRVTFDDLCLLFHDTYGGSVIGLLWKPQAIKQKEFKVSHINYSKLDSAGTDDITDVMLVPNMDAILEDIKIIGKGLVQTIEVNKTV